MGRLFLCACIFIISVVFLLFFPIVVETDIHFDVNRKKFAFSVYLYKVIKVFGGYATTYPGGVALHISSKKAILIPYKEANSRRKKFSFVKTFRLIALSITTETGAEYLFPVSIMHTALRAYFFMVGGDKEKIENNLWLTDGDVLRVSLNNVIYFNGYILLVNFLKFIKEKMKILWQKKKEKSIV